MRDYNFFEPYQKKSGVSFNPKSTGFVSMIMILIITGTSVGIIAANKMLESDVESAREELSKIQSSEEYKAADELQKTIDVLTKYDENANIALERIKKGDLLGTKFLTTLSNSIPKTVKIQEANITRTVSNISFYVPNRSTAAELLDSLDKSGLFVHTFLSSIEKEGETGEVAEEGRAAVAAGYTAQISMVMKAGEE